jgi:hypothetical protein
MGKFYPLHETYATSANSHPAFTNAKLFCETNMMERDARQVSEMFKQCAPKCWAASITWALTEWQRDVAAHTGLREFIQ